MKSDDNSGMYRVKDDLQGDSKPMPDRGTGSGVTDTYGADISEDATNRLGGMGTAANSNAVKPA